VVLQQQCDNATLIRFIYTYIYTYIHTLADSGLNVGGGHCTSLPFLLSSPHPFP